MKVMVAVIVLLIAVYVIFSGVVLGLSWWLKGKMRENPTADIENYCNCPWYIAPKTSSDRLAHRLVDRNFLQNFGDFWAVCLLFLVFAVAVLLFCIYAVNNH